ncbi:dethiobiotin synthase [Clostridium sp. MSJ-8]|uniref:dethiobiotin synthase n=1 Tax=Clostridium sp. MSJ-8 TaxID=2841510 RepID=UPI001C0E9E02|nr:dethiobiotin synthase [Clostridium sp. MSJ-8]MBU5487968.1 dethiobiotin synthase [Clostridium sp. MSJ-8]
MSRNLFVTGTGTDVGKTYITGLIIKKLYESGRDVAYYKAAMSGNIRDEDGKLIPGDALSVKRVSGIDQKLEDMCPYVYENAVSPHLASRLEGNPVRLDVVKDRFIKVSKEHDYVTMEGSGGILCPICFDEEKIQLEDIIKELNLSCIIIADAGLGTINNVVLTVEYMKNRGITVKGIIFNNYHEGNIMEEDNLKMCEYMTGVKVIGCVKESDTDINIDADVLASLYE